jgi:hypothetical protein
VLPSASIPIDRRITDAVVELVFARNAAYNRDMAMLPDDLGVFAAAERLCARALQDLGAIVILLPVESQSGLGCTMPIIVVRMQVLAGRRDRCVPQVVPHVSQVHLPVHHV